MLAAIKYRGVAVVALSFSLGISTASAPASSARASQRLGPPRLQLRHASASKPSAHPRRPLRRGRARAAIVGGTAAENGAYPWLAYVVDERGEEVTVCTGTVVADNVILTAAHCAEDVKSAVVNEPSGYRVITGNVDRTAAGDQVSTVTGVAVDPQYNPATGANDAAVLILSSPISAPAIALAALPANASLLEAGTPAVIAGWGKTGSEELTYPERLRWAETVVQSAASCESQVEGFDASSELCALNPPSFTTGICQGDSGAPLIAYESGTPVQIGLADIVPAACSTTSPDVFSRADVIGPWVKEMIEASRPVPPVPVVPVPVPTPAPTPSPSPPTTSPPPPPPLIAHLPPEIPGEYATPQSRTRRIAARVAADGQHLVRIQVKALIKCQHKRSVELDDSWLSSSETVTIQKHVARISGATLATKYWRAGYIGVYMQFNGSGIAEGRVRVRVRSRDRRTGLCYAGAIRFVARRTGP
jgi:trypsin